MKLVTPFIKFQKIILLACMVLISCDSENANDCFQAAGDSVRVTMPVTDFDQIQIEGEVILYITQGDIQEVIIETGSNLLNDVSVTVASGNLKIKDNNSCNFVRDYQTTIAYVTTPNVTRIRNASSFDIHSVGTLNFDELLLISDTRGGVDDPRKGGDFYLDINTTKLNVRANGQSVFFISGNTIKADIRFNDENPRFEGRDLRINELDIVQRSANKMIVQPLDQITGRLVGTGDVICVTRPPIVDVAVLFTGQLIFE